MIGDINKSRRLTQPATALTQVLLGGPRLDADFIAVMDEIEAECKQDFGREIDL